MSQKLPRESRITRPKEYTQIFQGGKMLKGKYWQVIAKPTTHAGPKLGLAISKKVFKLAVERNRIKRIARETFRLEKSKLDPWGFVVMARKNQNNNYAELSNELINLFHKLAKN